MNEKDPYHAVRQQHAREVAGNGNFPLDSEYIDEFIASKARTGPDWAIAYALLHVGYAIRSASRHIAGVDDWTGQQRIAAALEAIAEQMKRRE